MANSERPAPRVPRGAPLDSEDAALDAAAEVTPEDVERAKQWWTRHAAPEYRELLNAEPAEDE